MILATALGVLFVPVFFVLIRKLFVRRRAAALVAPVATVPPGEQG